MNEDDISCPEYRGCIDIVDSTFDSETNEHTGDIYYCEECEQYYIFVLATCELKEWTY